MNKFSRREFFTLVVAVLAYLCGIRPDIWAALRLRAGRNCKIATDSINEATRIQMRENGFYRRILPPLAIANDELDRCVDTDGILSRAA